MRRNEGVTVARPFNEYEAKRAGILKTWRAAIRLRHSLEADEEIARTLPEVEAVLDRALHDGESVTLDVANVFRANL